MPRGLTSNQYRLHPQPKKISIFDDALIWPGPPPAAVPFFEWAPSKTIDFMRYRMSRDWSGTWHGGMGIGNMGPGQPITIFQWLRQNPPSGQSYSNTVSWAGGQWTRTEKITIGYYEGAIATAAGSADPRLTTRDKWLYILDDGQFASGDWTVDPAPGPHGIISTFSKLQIDNDHTNPIHFTDYVLDYNAPLDKKKIGDNYYGSLTVSEAEVVPSYNFYIQAYESILTQPDDPNKEPHESMLPSLYSFLSVIENENDKRHLLNSNSPEYDMQTINTIFEKHITLNGTIQGTRVATDVTYNAGGRSRSVEADVSKGQYFDKYAYAFAAAAKDTSVPSWDQNTSTNDPYSLSQKFKNQIVPMDDIEVFATFNEIANRFPMYYKINFSTSNTLFSEAVSLLEDSNLMPMLIKDFVDGTMGAPQNMDFRLAASGLNLPFTGSTWSKGTGEVGNELVSGKLKCWDMSAWISTLSSRGSAVFQKPLNGVFLGQYNPESLVSQANSMLTNFKVLIAKAQLQYLINTKTRTWAQLVDGQKAYHETVFYKVEKWYADADGNPINPTTPNEPVQTFYFPNSTKLDEHNFTDTQVKYGKKYIYRIYAVEMVFATEYWYQLNDAPTSNYEQVSPVILHPDQAQICALSKPLVKLVEVPYYQKESVMMDSPPVWPDVEVITRKNIKDQIFFWLTGNAGDYKMRPIIIQPDDEEAINSIRLAQELNSTEPVRFKGDDQARFFEVFRLEKKPTRYSDFRGAKIAHIDTKININQQCQFSTSGAWIDNIKPNQKYYYIFRTLDNHNHFSNPSPVYELEMVYDGFAPFLLRNVYYLDENAPPPQKPAKKFTKYIYIKPAFAQRIINEQESGLKDADGNHMSWADATNGLTNKQTHDPSGGWLHLGVNDQSLWDKLFKIRVISRKTGKKIDLNIKFTKKHRIFQEGDNNNLC